jgi:hypothetical protein
LHEPADILALLDAYGTETYERERERVQLAILKLSKGDREALIEYVRVAKRDYRNVLAWAEYPRAMGVSVVGESTSDAAGRQEIRESDLHQYLSWLQETDMPDTSGYRKWPENRDSNE